MTHSSQPLTPEATIDVLVVGAGPTGLTLACALALRGVRSAVIDRQPAGDNTSRAAVVHARTLEVLEPLGVAAELVARGIPAHRFTIRDRDRVLVPIDFSELPTRYPYTLMVSQAVTEEVLLERLTALGASVQRPRVLQTIAQDAVGVTATLDDGSRIRARYLVGCDGMHSAVREQTQIAFRGDSYGESFVLADVHLGGGSLPADEVVLYFSPAGMVVVAPLPDGVHRIVATWTMHQSVRMPHSCRLYWMPAVPPRSVRLCGTCSGDRASACITAWPTPIVPAVYCSQATRRMCTARQVVRA